MSASCLIVVSTNVSSYSLVFLYLPFSITLYPLSSPSHHTQHPPNGFLPLSLTLGTARKMAALRSGLAWLLGSLACG